MAFKSLESANHNGLAQAKLLQKSVTPYIQMEGMVSQSKEVLLLPYTTYSVITLARLLQAVQTLEIATTASIPKVQ